MKKPILKFAIPGVLLLVSVIAVASYDGETTNTASLPLAKVLANSPAIEINEPFPLEENYRAIIDNLEANLSQEMKQPDISREDVLRGWYLSPKEGKKYGTPEAWVFIEEGDNSRWTSPNVTEEEEEMDQRALCVETAGHYSASCLQTTDAQCQNQEKNSCECSDGTKWKQDQGCILTNTKGSFVALNTVELEQGFYLGLPNQKKLNTPENWGWFESGKNSTWRKY